MFSYASHQSMNDTFFNCSFTPFCVLYNFTCTFGFVAFGKINQSFSGVFSTVEQDIFDKFQQIFWNFLVDIQHAGVNNSHVETGVNRVIQKSGVHCFTDRIITPERKGNVAHSTTDQRSRTAFFNLFYCFNESHRIVVVFLHSSGHSQNIRIKNNIVRRKSNVFGQQLIGSTADFNFLFEFCCLTGFIKSHHHCCRAVLANFPCLHQEIFLAFLEADRVDYAFALDALQSGFKHGPF